MPGIIFLVIYVLLQTGISIVTENVIKRNTVVGEIGRKTRILRIIIYVVLALIPVLGAFLPGCKFKYLCMGIGNVWLGFFMYYSGLVLFLALITFIICKIRKDDERKLIGHAFIVAFIFGLIITCYGLIHAQQPKEVDYSINLEKKVEGIENMKVVLLGDLHLSVNSNVKATEKMVDIVNSCNADVVVIAGDIFTSTYAGLSHPEKYAEALSKMKAKYGVYVVAGNHDVEENLFGGFSISPVSEAFRTGDMDKFFEMAGFNMLYDDTVTILDGKVNLVGRIDGEKAGDGTRNRMSAGEVLKGVDKTKPVIVLQHEPIEFKDLSDNGADMVLCGHTHNGQLFPGNFVVPFFNENGYGVKNLYGMETVVTAGVGYYGPPMRIGTDSEVTLLNISFGE